MGSSTEADPGLATLQCTCRESPLWLARRLVTPIELREPPLELDVMCRRYHLSSSARHLDVFGDDLSNVYIVVVNDFNRRSQSLV
jgi:hypothetical protein